MTISSWSAEKDGTRNDTKACLTISHNETIDKNVDDVEDTIKAIAYAGSSYSPNPSSNSEILATFELWLRQPSRRVWERAIGSMVDLAEKDFNSFPSKSVLKAVESFASCKVYVFSTIKDSLLSLYCKYCVEYSEGRTNLQMHYERIPYNIIVYYLENPCKMTSPQRLDEMISDRIFPRSISDESRADHWISFLSFFSSSQREKLAYFLSVKRRGINEMKEFLEKVKQGSFQEEPEDYFLSDSLNNLLFRKLWQIKDDHIFMLLHLLLNEVTSTTVTWSFAGIVLSSFPEDVACSDLFSQILNCSYSFISHEYVKRCLDILNRRTYAIKKEHAFDFLLLILEAFPELLREYEKPFLTLFLNKSDPLIKEVLGLLLKLARHIFIPSCDICPSLERMCQMKSIQLLRYAVSITKSMVDSSGMVVPPLRKITDAAIYSGHLITAATSQPSVYRTASNHKSKLKKPRWSGWGGLKILCKVQTITIRGLGGRRHL